MNKNKSLRAYTVFERHEGTDGGAVLAFHFTAREAKNLAWEWVDNADGFTDVGVRWIRHAGNLFPLADQAKLKENEPHIVEITAFCLNCDCWGGGVDMSGARATCNVCGEYPGHELEMLFGAHELDKQIPEAV